jgi:hypothetical protein
MREVTERSRRIQFDGELRRLAATGKSEDYENGGAKSAQNTDVRLRERS